MLFAIFTIEILTKKNIEIKNIKVLLIPVKMVSPLQTNWENVRLLVFFNNSCWPSSGLKKYKIRVFVFVSSVPGLVLLIFFFLFF